MDGIQMEPVGKYKDRNGSAKAAWRNMVDQDLDDVAFLADSDKAREARELRETPVAVCSQRRALCLLALVCAAMFATALVVVYAAPQPDCPCATESMLVPGSAPTDSDAASANKERIATNGAVFPWRGARLPAFIIPKHYSLWLHPNLTTGELKGEVSIDFKVDRDTTFIVLNVRDLNVTERALFKSGGSLGPKVAKVLDYPPADQTYIEFKEKLRRKYNYTLSLRFITKLDRSDKQRGFFLAGNHKNRCAVSRFWLTHARSAFPCLDEPHLRATFRLTIVRDRFHVSLTNMPIVATEEAGFYLGHRLLQDEFATSPPMPPHMMSLVVCRLQRRAAPPLPTPHPPPPPTTEAISTTTEGGEDDYSNLPPPEISLYSDKQVILDESGPFLDWVQRTIQLFAYELNTSYPLPKLDLVIVEGGAPYAEGWGLITLGGATPSDGGTVARLLAQQWFGGLVSPRWWSAQWLMEALTSVLGERAPPLHEPGAERTRDALLLDHILPALRLDSSNSVRAVASPRLERADIESAADELSLHKGAAIVSMAIEAAGEAAGRAALARLLKDHRSASADARDLWRALARGSDGGDGQDGPDGPDEAPAHAWDGWCERAGYPLLSARNNGSDVLLRQERFVMSAEPPAKDPPLQTYLLTLDLRNDLDEIFYEPENFTDPSELDANATTTTPPPPPTQPPRPKLPPPPVWVIPLTFTVGPLLPQHEEEQENITAALAVAGGGRGANLTTNGTWYDVGNGTKPRVSRWTENTKHLIWMNETEIVIPDLGKHKWVRYNVGARGLYRVAPQDHTPGESAEAAGARAAALYESGGPAERALLLDDAFVLSRAGRLPASRAIAAAARLISERHWAPWRVGLSHLSWWVSLLRAAASGPPLARLLARLPPAVTVYTPAQLNATHQREDHIWLSGALLTAGVEWENARVTKQAVKLFDGWAKDNQTIPDMYQEAAFTAGVRAHGAAAWALCWRALLGSYAAPRPTHSHRALLAALASPTDDWLFYRFAYTVMSAQAQRGHEWRLWVTQLATAACRWRGAAGVWRVLRPAPAPALPPAALLAAARCLHQPHDYYRFKELFGSARGAAAALDTIALNAAWVPRADQDLSTYFAAVSPEGGAVGVAPAV